MARYLYPLVLLALLAAGCSSSTPSDTGPSVLGFTPELRDQLRAYIRANAPNTDAEAAVSSYMEELSEMAKDFKIAPNDKGDLLFPAAMKVADKISGPEDVKEVTAILNEFDTDVPIWAQALFKQYQSGSLPKELNDLLVATMRTEVLRVQVGLSK
ncbi:hypothetical protein [Aeoliella sp.]|uniref:hypothetical protein n=1 Tax=Aeoliella sp. TaxID=2795800 RepID=UPI003CCC3B1D